MSAPTSNQSPKEPSLYQKYQQATSGYYYDINKDPLNFAPLVKDREIAHTLALKVEEDLANISDAEVAKSALHAMHMARQNPHMPEKDVLDYKEDALQDRLRSVVKDVERTHAKLAPGDFSGLNMQTAVYKEGTGYEPKEFSPEDVINNK